MDLGHGSGGGVDEEVKRKYMSLSAEQISRIASFFIDLVCSEQPVALAQPLPVAGMDDCLMLQWLVTSKHYRRWIVIRRNTPRFCAFCGRADIEAGRTIPHEKVKTELLGRAD